VRGMRRADRRPAIAHTKNSASMNCTPFELQPGQAVPFFESSQCGTIAIRSRVRVRTNSVCSYSFTTFPGARQKPSIRENWSRLFRAPELEGLRWEDPTDGGAHRREDASGVTRVASLIE
jgi:hypothetical protein